MFCLQSKKNFTTLEKKYKHQGYFKQGDYKNKGDYRIIARKLGDELHLNVISHIINPENNISIYSRPTLLHPDWRLMQLRRSNLIKKGMNHT